MKINISVPDELSARVDKYCEENCLKRSVVYQIAVSQLINQKMAVSAMQDIAWTLKKIAQEGKIDDDAREALADFERVCRIIGQSQG